MDAILVSVEVTTPEGVTVTYTPQVGVPVPGPGIPEAPEDDVTYGRRNAAWVDVNAASLPAGGTVAQVLTKLSATDGDAGWATPRAVGIAPIAFAYGDATPSPIYTAPVAGTIVYVRLAIETAFNGTGSSMALGTTGSLSSLLSASENATNEQGDFENTPDIHLTAGQQVFVSITPGVGASQGAGRIYLQFNPD